jgi:hypothetical protein
VRGRRPQCRAAECGIGRLDQWPRSCRLAHPCRAGLRRQSPVTGAQRRRGALPPCCKYGTIRQRIAVARLFVCSGGVYGSNAAAGVDGPRRAREGEPVVGRGARDSGRAGALNRWSLIAMAGSGIALRCQHASGRWGELWTRHTPATGLQPSSDSDRRHNSDTQARPTTKINTNNPVLHP